MCCSSQSCAPLRMLQLLTIPLVSGLGQLSLLSHCRAAANENELLAQAVVGGTPPGGLSSMLLGPAVTAVGLALALGAFLFWRKSRRTRRSAPIFFSLADTDVAGAPAVTMPAPAKAAARHSKMSAQPKLRFAPSVPKRTQKSNGIQ